MSTTSTPGNESTKRGRPRSPARTRRGRAILAALDAQGLTMHGAAKRARLTFESVQRAIHGDPSRLSVRTVAALVHIGLPLDLVAPQLATKSTKSSAVA